MFPQSELDNYKLQVELLQEKLHRSEISRQQLERKLDKILQKRDEYDKVVRSKAKQKYQQFLEEQHRRNERNKQLLQMLERIEQQTEAMNSKSERLKMMKLQYEMYFAKLVHSQTKRCLQSSIQIIPMSSSQPMHPVGQQPVVEEHNYMTNIETLATCATGSYFEKDSFLRSHPENIPMKTTEMPTLDKFVRTKKNDCMDLSNTNVAPSTNTQQPEYEPNNNLSILTNRSQNKQENPDTISYPKVDANMSLDSETIFLPNNKQLEEFKEISNLSSISSPFDEISNIEVTPLNLNGIPNKTTTVTTTFNNTTNNNPNFQPRHNTQPINEISLKLTNQKNKDSASNLQNVAHNLNIVNKLSQDLSAVVNNASELKTPDVIMPKLYDEPSTSPKLEPIETVIETSPNSSNITNVQTAHIENESLANTTESDSFPTPVSIENIENKIYGELLTPLETEEVQELENLNVGPNLSENIVTQSENIEIKNIPSEEAIVNQDIVAITSSSKDTTAANNKTDQTPVLHNYEQADGYDGYNSAQQPEEVANGFDDYANYENIDSTATGENQQQPQQYDYSNYDPTQYSYPGYIYDETTGEYKPDPNVPAEKYSADQQYSSEGYDQQYQQQDYDYNQDYTEDPTNSSTTVDNTAYNNYDTTQPLISNFTLSDTNAEQQQIITESEPSVLQPNLSPEEIPISSTKITKPTSILSTADKNDSQKKKKRVNFIDSSETDESAAAEKGDLSANKPSTENVTVSSESDFDFPSSTEADIKVT